MPFTADDREAVRDLINLHGHFVDSGELERQEEIFTPDVEYDVTDLGGGVLRGLAGSIEAALALGAGNPVAHVVTNIVITGIADDEVHAISKGLGVTTAGGVGAVTYEDTIIRTGSGWRISHRRVSARRDPLNGRRG